MKRQVVIPVVYFLIVFVCLLTAFDFDGRLRSFEALLAAVLLTLPWSIVSVLFLWALIHGAGLEFFTVMYSLFAAVNAFILYRISRPRKMSKTLNGEFGVGSGGQAGQT